jgi:hypothetical protein
VFPLAEAFDCFGAGTICSFNVENIVSVAESALWRLAISKGYVPPKNAEASFSKEEAAKLMSVFEALGLTCRAKSSEGYVEWHLSELGARVHGQRLLKRSSES